MHVKHLRLVLLCCFGCFYFCTPVSLLALDTEGQPQFAASHPHSCMIKRYSAKNLGQPHIQDYARPVMEKSYSLPEGHFLIHYDTQGYHAVNLSDHDANGIPDYVDSVAYFAEYVYHQEVEVMGFQAPLYDYVDSAHVDIYLMQLGKAPGASIGGQTYTRVYGLTFDIDARLSACDSNQLHASAFMVMDNDFAMSDSVDVTNTQNVTVRTRTYKDTGMIAVRITLAHEFHHVIQFGYTDNLHPIVFNEMTSVWMEHRLFPFSTDYFQYLSDLMAHSDSYYLTSNEKDPAFIGYSHAIFFQFLEEKGQPNAVLNMWRIMGNCASSAIGSGASPNPFFALDSALKQNGSSLPQQWNRFITTFYHTGYRAPGNAEALSNAALMPQLTPDNRSDVKFSEPFFYDLTLYPFQTKLIRCTFGTDASHAADTVDVIFSNTGQEFLRSGSLKNELSSITISRIQQSGYKRIGSTNYYYSINKAGSNCMDTMFLNGGIAVSQIDSPYPQPYSLGSSFHLRFPVAETIPSDAKVHLSISTPDGVTAYEEEVIVIADPQERTRYVTWTKQPQNLSSGVYLYAVSYQSDTQVGSILLKP